MTIWIGIKDGALLGNIDDYVLSSSKKDSSQKFFVELMHLAYIRRENMAFVMNIALVKNQVKQQKMVKG